MRSDVVRGRRPLARDPSIKMDGSMLMDHEVMSDQEWEEEPEGEDLSVRSLLFNRVQSVPTRAAVQPEVGQVLVRLHLNCKRCSTGGVAIGKEARSCIPLERISSQDVSSQVSCMASTHIFKLWVLG